MPVNYETPSLQYTIDLVKIEDSDLKASAADETDQQVTETSYTQKYSLTLSPTAFQKAYGKRATLVVEINAGGDDGSGYYYYRSLVNGGDAVQTQRGTGSGTQTSRHVHADITDFSSDITITVEGYCGSGVNYYWIYWVHVYLIIGTKSTTRVELLEITNLESEVLAINRVEFGVYTGASDTATIYLFADSDYGQLGSASGSDVDKHAGDFAIVPVDSYLKIDGKTDNANNPMVIDRLYYVRGYFS